MKTVNFSLNPGPDGYLISLLARVQGLRGCRGRVLR